LLLVHAAWIAAEILFYREAVKKIGAESPTPARNAGDAPKNSNYKCVIEFLNRL
jgi:hypothetical protein